MKKTTIKNKFKIKVMGFEHELLVEQECVMWENIDGMLCIYEYTEHGVKTIAIPVASFQWMKSDPLEKSETL